MNPSGSVDRVHLVGIGGMHMSAIAQLLLADGIAVSGSDTSPSALTDRLVARGATVQTGHAAEHVGGARLVVTTAAAKHDNPELVEARRRGIPVLMRHEMVARLMEGRLGVAVAGTHGKTTTSSLLAWILQQAGMAPTYLLGGESLDLGGNAAPGTGAHVVVEADEYAGAFLAYHPQVAVITNVEIDHLDYYGTSERLVDAFRHCAANGPRDGLRITCADSPLLEGRIGAEGSAIEAAIERYSIEQDAEWRAVAIEAEPGGGSSFTVVASAPAGSEAADRPSMVHGRFATLLPGRHNVSNALAAIAACHTLGIAQDSVRAALAGFHGAHRRFELIGEANGITIIDDYAHHPTEVRVNLEAARVRYPGRRIVALFQPHTYSRTAYLLDGFRTCFAAADRLYLLQTFAARETAEAGLDARRLAEEITTPAVYYLQNADEALHALGQDLRPGDVCFTMGAGDVTKIGPLLLEMLVRR